MSGIKPKNMDPTIRQKWMAARTTHGGYSGGKETATHYVWRAMVRRCTYLNAKDYEHYGGRGITVCDRWLKYEKLCGGYGTSAEA